MTRVRGRRLRLRQAKQTERNSVATSTRGRTSVASRWNNHWQRLAAEDRERRGR